MPTHKVKNGYQWGNHGKVYPTKAQADKQGQAIYASGWREKKKVNESFTHSKLILMGVLRKVGDELYEKGYDENLIDNYINNKNIQMEMSNDGYSFFFNNTLIFHIESYPQLNDIIDKASHNIIQWFENNIKNVQESKIMAKKQLIRLTESDLHKIIEESVNRILKENYQDFDGFDNDLNYQSIFDQACDYLITKNPKTQYWKRIAQDMGFQLQTIGPNDMETMKDAIEDAMRECGDVQDEYYDSRVNLDNTMLSKRYGNNNIHDYKGKAAMRALGAYGKEGEKVGQNDSGVGEYDRYDDEDFA